MASGFVFMPLLIGRFGLDDYGLFLLAGSLSGYLGLLDLGVGTSLIKFVAEHRAKHDEAGLGSTVSTALLFYLIIGVVASLLMVAVAFFGVQFFKLPPSSEHLARNLFLVGAATALISWPASTSGYVLAGLQRYDIGATVGIGVTAGNIVVTATVVLMKQGPLALLVATSLVGILASAFNAYFALRELGHTPLSLRSASFVTLRRIFRFSSVVFVTQLCAVLIYQQTDRVVLGVFVGAASIGLYEAAQKLHSLVRQLAGLMGSAIVPAASQLDAEKRSDTLEALFLRGTKYTVILVTPIVVALVILARPLLTRWLGPEFNVMTVGAQLYVSYWLLNANTVVAGAILMGTDKMRFVMWYTLAGALANLVLSVVLVQYLGIIGVIIGTIVPYYVGFPIYMWFVSRLLGFHLSTWLKRVILPTYPWLIVPGLAAWAFRAGGLTESLVGVAIAGIVSVGLYWVAVLAFALTTGERQDVARMYGAARRMVGLS